MYSSIHIFSETFTPLNLDRLPELFGHFSATSLDHLVIYGDPLLWYQEPPKPLMKFENLSLDAGVAEISKHPNATYHLALKCKMWSRQFAADLSAIPRPLSAGFVPWDVWLTIGPSEISDTLLEKTIAKPFFDLRLSGDHVPTDPLSYLEEVKRISRFENVQKFLREWSGSPRWKTSITCYC